MNKVNYQKELDGITGQIEENGVRPRLLLHSCCAPCSSYCLVYLRRYFDITCLYYNPNITDEAEYRKRTEELKRLCLLLGEDSIGIVKSQDGSYTFDELGDEYLAGCGHVDMIEGRYEPELFLSNVKDKHFENLPEGGARCAMCFDMRLREAERAAAEGSYDYFATSLTISPLKNADLINRTGLRIAEEGGGKVKWLPSDFKKKNGYLISTQLCKRYGMYRQNYCGCVYSQREEDKG